MHPKLFAALQYLAPQRALSRAAGWLADTRIKSIKEPFIRWFIGKYSVDMNEAMESDGTAYQNFNEFFTRALKDGARLIAAGENTMPARRTAASVSWGKFTTAGFSRPRNIISACWN